MKKLIFRLNGLCKMFFDFIMREPKPIDEPKALTSREFHEYLRTGHMGFLKDDEVRHYDLHDSWDGDL